MTCQVKEGKNRSKTGPGYRKRSSPIQNTSSLPFLTVKTMTDKTENTHNVNTN